ncbi:SLC13 family permease [bacterium SCSIO 12741]|nr:SLC13 family permease [bacterium SCSIO 12741]
MMLSDHQIIVGILALFFGVLIWDRWRASLVFIGTAVLYIFLGYSDFQTFLSFLSNEQLLTILMLIIVANLIKDNIQLDRLFGRLLGKEPSPGTFLFRMTTGVSLFSSILNNTPIVALLIPYVQEWSRKMEISPSKTLIPLSYAAITGGTLTVIGTSTNLVLNGMLSNSELAELSTFHYLIPGAMVTFGGILFLTFFSGQLLPDRISLMQTIKNNPKEFILETKIPTLSDLVGHTIQDAGLRNLQGGFLTEIIRGTEVITPVSPREVLQANDRLLFAGDTVQLLELIESREDMILPKDSKFNLGKNQQIQEVIIPFNSNLIGKKVKESNFRETYDAAIIGIHRNGETLSGKIGDQVFQPGDFLLLTTGEGFRQRLNTDRNLYFISTHRNRKTEEAPSLFQKLYLPVILGVLLLALFGVLPLLPAVSLILFTLIATGRASLDQIKKNLNLDIAAIIASAFLIGDVLIQSGTTNWIAESLLFPLQDMPLIGVSLCVFLLAMAITNLLTNVAAVSILFPIVYSLTLSFPEDSSFVIFLSLAFGASASFLTPYGYQTNLMISAAGAYRMKDFLKIGVFYSGLYFALFAIYLFLTV